MNAARFAVAKFIPDLTRMEPRNIGVIAWRNGECGARFAGDDRVHDSGLLASLRIPDKDTYQQWLDYWRHQMNQTELRTRTGRLVARDSPEFFTELCRKSKDSFSLHFAGYLHSLKRTETAPRIAEALYKDLVLPPAAEHVSESDPSRLRPQDVKAALELSGLAGRPGFRRHYEYPCPVGSTLQHFHFHYAIYDDSPRLVLQKVHLQHQPSVHDAAFMFQALAVHKMDSVARAALVYADADLLDRDESVQQSMDLIRSWSTIVNIADQREAIRTLGNLAV